MHMITAKEIQNSYNNLYVGLREYIWPLDTIQCIANLEVSVYKSFPNLAEVHTYFANLKSQCYKEIRDDEDLKKKFDDFDDTLSGSDTIYSKLDKREEGVI